MRLVSLSGGEYPLEKPVSIIGRSRSSDIQLDNPRVSTRHAAVRIVGESVIVEDLGSTNGTYVNGRRIAGPTPVKPGDQIEFADAAFTFEVGVQAAPPVPPEPPPAVVEVQPAPETEPLSDASVLEPGALEAVPPPPEPEAIPEESEPALEQPVEPGPAEMPEEYVEATDGPVIELAAPSPPSDSVAPAESPGQMESAIAEGEEEGEVAVFEPELAFEEPRVESAPAAQPEPDAQPLPDWLIDTDVEPREAPVESETLPIWLLELVDVPQSEEAVDAPVVEPEEPEPPVIEPEQLLDEPEAPLTSAPASFPEQPAWEPAVHLPAGPEEVIEQDTRTPESPASVPPAPAPIEPLLEHPQTRPRGIPGVPAAPPSPSALEAIVSQRSQRQSTGMPALIAALLALVGSIMLLLPVVVQNTWSIVIALVCAAMAFLLAVAATILGSMGLMNARGRTQSVIGLVLGVIVLFVVYIGSLAVVVQASQNGIL